MLLVQRASDMQCGSFSAAVAGTAGDNACLVSSLLCQLIQFTTLELGVPCPTLPSERHVSMLPPCTLHRNGPNVRESNALLKDMR